MKKLIVLFILTIPLFAGTSAFGQKNLERWVKECEKDASVDMTVIDNKFPDTKKRDSYIVKITLDKNSDLVNKMYEAYKKDKADSYSFSDKRVNGVMQPDQCRFRTVESDKTETETVFDFYYRQKQSTQVSITIIKTFDVNNKELDKKRNKHYLGG